MESKPGSGSYLCRHVLYLRVVACSFHPDCCSAPRNLSFQDRIRKFGMGKFGKWHFGEPSVNGLTAYAHLWSADDLLGMCGTRSPWR